MKKRWLKYGLFLIVATSFLASCENRRAVQPQERAAQSAQAEVLEELKK